MLRKEVIMEAFTTLITQVGFPIAACCFIAWQYVKQTEVLSTLTNTLRELSENLGRMEQRLENIEHTIHEGMGRDFTD